MRIPSFIEPMLPTLSKQPFSNPAWLFEPKWDGYRAICYLKDGKLNFLSRRRNDLSPKFPDLQRIAKSIKANSAIIDGEIVALDQNGIPCFNALRSHRREGCEIVFYAFDLLHLDGDDLTQLPLLKRKAILKRIMPKRDTGRLRYTEHIIGEGEQLFKELEKRGLEGRLRRRLTACMLPGERGLG